MGILVPIALFVLVDTFSLYRQALEAVNIAYDRTLLASAKAIGELLKVEGDDEFAVIKASIPYSALEPFEADNRSRMTYRVSDKRGLWIDGAQDLPAWSGKIPNQGPYAALVDFYDDTFRGDPVRVAVLLQPVATGRGRAMATVQVAETLELRRTLARQILMDTLRRQALLIGVIAIAVLLVVHRVTRPVRQLSNVLDARNEDDLTPIDASALPREIQPLTDATNQVMQRLQHLLENQKRFVRDAAHQLRTPLAVLKVQVQSALRGDWVAKEALEDIQRTVDRATQLANQMLALAKVEQVRQQQDFQDQDWAEVVRALALDVSPLIAEKDLDFEISTAPCWVHAHEWMLREMVRNLLHNAIRHTPQGGHLAVRLAPQGAMAVLVIDDSGSGITDELRLRLFQPFATGDARSGSGLGLMITREMVTALGGSVQLSNRIAHQQVQGLAASISLPLSASAAH
ncbi:sensor histidine kinase [Rhodoferax aquaticus]|uniref:histidine kinase n=1 Tax=Rhodoferax aquaticus TaxID=2527691 RepID=A0A515EVL0_9BURK|nr:sensor histidine kinase [Rhodoferax aquaticus]QDL56727.1 sensor histidine kinase [Rhodoferax aquaticus]